MIAQRKKKYIFAREANTLEIDVLLYKITEF